MGVSERRKFKATSNRFSRTVLLSRTVVINGIRLGWIVVLVWGELGIYFWSLSSCKWPESTEWHRAKPTHVLLLSDPQVRHPSVMWGEGWVKSLGQFLYEANLKRSWHVTRRLNPHAVFFLGDMLSSGKYVRSEVEYKAYWQKFQAIFQPDGSLPQYFLPGNNDVGMGLAHSSPKNVRLYYSSIVGPFNSKVVIRDHVFICLDAPSLVDEDYLRSASGKSYELWDPIRGGSVEFVKSASIGGSRAILLSHIPLARPDTATCGPLREKGSIRRGVGHGYQNTLGKQTTTFLLKTLRPSIIFSGDNRDYCEYNHPVEVPDREAEESTVPIREVTVKSFSLSNHIRRPGFQLVSLVDPTPFSKSIMDAPCLLPDPYRVYTSLYTPPRSPHARFSIRLQHVPVAALAQHRSPSHLPFAIEQRPAHPAPPWVRRVVALHARQARQPAGLAPPVAAHTQRLIEPDHARRLAPRDAPRVAAAGPSVVFHHEEEEEDALYPTQYAVQRNGHVSDGEEWPARGDDPAPSYFLDLPAPGAGNPKQAVRRPTWSWTFVFRGRRRRMTLSVPTWDSVREFAAQLTYGADGDMMLRRRGVAWSTVIDGLGILWPTFLAWILCAWWMF
ncbi:Metallophos domain-containing protein [Mycena venus]|uniref:Metallophos domain-containing protein n=1 Tax=Mycena venus TaxID=2733690 RepID=A0A8H6YKW9_9AGAR|nr:Metallophos domain-containing protein [Mycena venus]